MGSALMGKVLVAATVENLDDLFARPEGIAGAGPGQAGGSDRRPD